MSKGKQLALNTIIVGISKVSTALAVFVVLPIYTKHLTTGEYGVVDLVTVYAALIVPTLTLRLELAIFRWLIDARKDTNRVRTIISNTLRIVVLSTTIFSLAFWAINFFIPIPYAPLIYLYLIASVLSGIALQIARGLGNIRIFAIGGITNGALSAAVGGTLVAVFGMGVNGVLTGMLVGAAAASLLVITTLKLPRLSFGPRDHSLQKEMIQFSTPMIPNGLSGWAIIAGSKVIISATLGVTANGIYAVAGRFTTLFSGLYEVFNITWTESASINITSKGRDEFFTKTINAAFLFFGSVSILLIAALPIAFPWFVNESFSSAAVYIPILTIGFLFDTIVRMIGALYVALRLTRQVMYTTITAAAISLTGTLLFINTIGLWAPVIASVVGLATMAVFRYYDIRRRGVNVRIRPLNILLIALGLGLVLTVYYAPVASIQLNLMAVFTATVFGITLNRDIVKLILSLKK